MAKIQLTSETRSQNWRKPGFALLTISGWKHSPELSEMSIQRSEDEKYLGEKGQWNPIPFWHKLEMMTVTENETLEADVSPAFVDPIAIAPNNSYRVTLRSGSESETKTMRIANGVLASSAAGNSPEPLEHGSGLILGAAFVEPPEPEPIIEPAPEPEPAVIKEVIEETVEPMSISSADEIENNGFFARHKGKIIAALIALLLLVALGFAWYFKLFPDFSSSTKETNSTENLSSPDSTSTANLTDLELLQKFIRSKPDTNQILAQAKEWGKTSHCDAMLRLLVHSAHKSNDSKIALEYAKMYDPAEFSKGGCIEKADTDTAQYWYQKAVEGGNSEAQSLLKTLETELKEKNND